MNTMIQDIFDFVRANPGMCKHLIPIPIDPPILIPAGTRFYNIEIMQDIHVNYVTIFMPSKSIRFRSLEQKTLVRDPDNCFLFLKQRDLNLDGLYSPRVLFELMTHLKKLASSES